MVLQSNFATKRPLGLVSNVSNVDNKLSCLQRRKQSSILRYNRARLNKSRCSARYSKPQPTRTRDAEATDATATSVGKSVSLKLPRQLSRPVLPEISHEALEAIDLSLKDVDVAYLRDHLESVGPEFFETLCRVQPPSSTTLPKELSVTVADWQPTSVFPTHVLAIFGPDHQKAPAKLHPIHSIYLAAHCSRLSSLPSTTSAPSLGDLSPEGNMTSTIPIVPIRLPSPNSYKPLFHYLYTKRSDILLASLLPHVPSEILASLFPHPDSQQRREAAAAHLASTYTPQVLLQHLLLHVYGLYSNACALGVVDNGLWEVLECAWEVLLAAYKMGSA